MADIAILVAEEYERRTKMDPRRSAGGEGDYVVVGVVSSVSFLPGMMVKGRVVAGEKAVAIMNRVLDEPKSGIGLAASHGFFSA